MGKFLKSLNKTSKKNPCLAFFITFFVCVAILIYKNVYPFGDRCILHIDLYHQYYPYFSEFQDVLRNNKSMQFSFNNGLGNDFLALFAYYLASPLNLLLTIWPHKYIIEFMTFLIVIKISFASMFAYKFFIYHFKVEEKTNNKKEFEKLYAVCLAVAYSLCGFIAAYSWNIMWLDSFALFSLILLGIDKIIRENKPACYYTSLALSIWANYYISIMICIFLVFYFICMLIENTVLEIKDINQITEKTKRSTPIKSVINFAVFSLLAASTSSVLIVSELNVLKYAYSANSGFPKKSTWYFSFLTELSRMSLGLKVYIDDNHLPNLYTGVVSILFILLYLFNKKIKIVKKVPRIMIMGIFFISFSNNILDFIWHGLHFPSFLPARQSFIFSFLILCIVFETLRNIEETRIKDVLCSLMIIAAVFIIQFKNNANNTELMFPFLITGGYIVVYSILLIVIKKVKIRKTFLIYLATFVFLSELTVNMGLVSFETTSRREYLAKSDDYNKIVEYLNNREGKKFYRIEQSERKTKNDAMLYNYSSATEFSSILNYNVSGFYQKLGLEGGINYYSYYGATPVISSMLSVKYYISTDGDDTDTTKKKIKKIGQNYIYENLYTLPIGFTVPIGSDKKWNEKDVTKIDTINSFVNDIAPENKTKNKTGYKNDTQIIQNYENKMQSQENELLQFSSNLLNIRPGQTTIKIIRPGHLYAVYDHVDIDYLDEYVDEKLKKTFSSVSNDYILDLGDRKLGEKIYLKNDSNKKIKFYLYNLNENKMKETYNSLNNERFELNSINKKGLFNGVTITGKLKTKSSKELVFSIPYQEGWKCVVNDKKVKIKKFKGTFLKIRLNKGENNIKLEYETPYIRIVLVCSIASIIAAILIIRIKRKIY